MRRLDGDRQEALESLVSERERVAQLRRALDVERERRMDLLPSVVQAGTYYIRMQLLGW